MLPTNFTFTYLEEAFCTNASNYNPYTTSLFPTFYSPFSNHLHLAHSQQSNYNLTSTPTTSQNQEKIALNSQFLKTTEERAIEQQRMDAQSSNSMGCKCVKTRCIKEYCSCFKNGGFCGVLCQCLRCRNVEKKRQIEKKGLTKCFCVKSKCDKKYCQCRSKGEKCGSQCGCENCLNK